MPRLRRINLCVFVRDNALAFPSGLPFGRGDAVQRGGILFTAGYFPHPGGNVMFHAELLIGNLMGFYVFFVDHLIGIAVEQESDVPENVRVMGDFPQAGYERGHAIAGNGVVEFGVQPELIAAFDQIQ